jgi:AhpD family alkylhydroperoxidase
VIRLLSGLTAPGVARTLLYRLKFFGKRHRAPTQAVMRGPSQWPVGEHEVLAAVLSKLNQCPLCIGVHSAIAEAAPGEDSTKRASLIGHSRVFSESGYMGSVRGRPKGANTARSANHVIAEIRSPSSVSTINPYERAIGACASGK